MPICRRSRRQQCDVRFNGRKENLHSLWDTGLVDEELRPRLRPAVSLLRSSGASGDCFGRNTGESNLIFPCRQTDTSFCLFDCRIAIFIELGCVTYPLPCSRGNAMIGKILSLLATLLLADIQLTEAQQT